MHRIVSRRARKGLKLGIKKVTMANEKESLGYPFLLLSTHRQLRSFPFDGNARVPVFHVAPHNFANLGLHSTVWRSGETIEGRDLGLRIATALGKEGHSHKSRVIMSYLHRLFWLPVHRCTLRLANKSWEMRQPPHPRAVSNGKRARSFHDVVA
jgi:hypothetical protein